jgi:hypothetical protein
MQVLAEEILSFLKLILNLDYIYNEDTKIFDYSRMKIIDITIYDTNEYFTLSIFTNSLEKININSYVEFFGTIRKISNLKVYNKTIKFICVTCGVIYSRNCEHMRNHKTLNSYYLNSDLIHCSNSNSNTNFVSNDEGKENDEEKIHKISKEFSDPILLRYFQ